jgi:pilus assembly protein CpaE
VTTSLAPAPTANAGPRAAERRTLLLAGPVPVPAGEAATVLQRAGYAAPAVAPTLDAALGRLAREGTSLVLVSLDASVDALEAVVKAAQTAGAGVFGIAPRLEPDLLLRAIRAGVHECLATPYDAEELAAALDRLERRARAGSAVGGAVAVYSAKGGVGTTTVAVSLAHAYARNNPRARVGLADFVVSGGDIAVQLDMLPKYDIGTLAGKVASLDAELLRSVLAERSSRLWVLAASERPELSELVDGAAANAIVGQLRRDFEFSVLDCEHHVNDRSLAALDAADRVVLVTQLGLAPLRSAQRSLTLFERLGYPPERVMVVVNRHQSGDVLTLEDAEQALEHPIEAALPNDFRLCADAMAKGLSVVEHAPDAPLSRAYLELAARFGGAPPEPLQPVRRGFSLRNLLGRS